jgi:cation transport ATPase
MKKVVFGILLLVVTFSTQAQEKKNKNAKFVIEVNGNCEMCQSRIQKAAYSVSGVKSAVWNMETHELSLILNEEKATILAVKTAIAKAGYDTDEVKALLESYDKLPGCCQYDRK